MRILLVVVVVALFCNSVIGQYSMYLYYDDRLGELRVGLYSSESNGHHVLFFVVIYL